MILKRIVTAVQVVTVAVVVVAVVLLVVRQPPASSTERGAAQGPGATPSAGAAGSGSPPDGKAIYATQCAACHGDFGEGTYGPAFTGGAAAQRFPDPKDQTAVVVTGVSGTPMKAFGPKLTPAEIEAVVAYTRTL